MDKKTFVAVAIAAVVTAGLTFIVTGFLASGQEVVEAGLDAQLETQIRAVIKEELQVDINGETKTYGQAMSLLITEVTAMKATIDVLVAE